MPSKDLVNFLNTQGHPVKSHMSAVDPTVANILRDRLKPKTPPPAKSPVKSKSTGPQGQQQSSSTARGPRTGPRTSTGSTASRSSGSGSSGSGSSGSGSAGTSSRTTDRKPAESRKEGRRGKVRYFPSQDQSSGGGGRTGAGRRGGRQRPRPDGGRRQVATLPEKLPDKVSVFAPVSLKVLSTELGVKADLLVKKLFETGKMVTINQYLDDDTVVELGIELGVEIDIKTKEEVLEESIRQITEFKSDESDLILRAPVVTFMGHVDHGKTSLLDKIREANVTTREAGGITQHLGAYRVERGDIRVTFIDTPGHKAFTEMRARGASATDLVVLVVAADDGPKPQTEEAINHARAAGVPIIVALNKIDTKGSNPERCKQELSKFDLAPPEWGGKTEYVEVSAMTGEGLDGLLETLSLESEILELKANPTRPGIGVVLEAEATTQRGVVATVLIQDGTLRAGDYVLCGASHGRVRNLLLNGSDPIKSAGPSVPVQIIGLNAVPATGDKLYVFADEKKARQIAEDRVSRLRESERAARQQVTLENLFDTLNQNAVQRLRLIIKADVQGSVEALKKSLEQLSHEEVRIVVLHSGVGAITQEDITLAAASQAVVIGFHVTADNRARSLAEAQGVDIRLYQVIYEALDDVKAALESRLAPEISEEIHGSAEIRQVYKASKLGNIAGCIVSSGHILRNDKIRIIRDGVVLYTGELGSLKRFKDDAKEVKEGYECGMKVSNYEDIKIGDIFEAFSLIETKRSL